MMGCGEENQTLVLVSHLTSSCWTRRDKTPATVTQQHHGTQWQPGPFTLSNFPHLSLMAMVDWSTWYKPQICPICFSLSLCLPYDIQIINKSARPTNIFWAQTGSKCRSYISYHTKIEKKIVNPSFEFFWSLINITLFHLDDNRNIDKNCEMHSHYKSKDWKSPEKKERFRARGWQRQCRRLTSGRRRKQTTTTKKQERRRRKQASKQPTSRGKRGGG